MKRLFIVFCAACLLCQPLVWVQRGYAEVPPATSVGSLRSSISPSLTLDQAVQEAVGNSPVVKTSVLDVGIAEDRIKAARSRFFPHTRLDAAGIQLITPLQFGFKKGALGTDTGGGPIPDENVQVRDNQKPLLFLNAAVIQPLLPLSVVIGLQQNKLARKVAQEKLEVDRQQIVNQVRHAYLQALQLQENAQVIEASIKLYREVVRMTNEYLKEKAVPLADSLEAKQILARAEYDNLHLQNELAGAKERLNQMLGRDSLTEFSLVKVSAVQFPDIDMSTAQAHAFRNRVELRRASHQQQQVALARRAVKAELFPDISLCMDYLSLFGTENILPKNIVFAGVVANWEPIDWGRRKAQIAEQNKQFKQSDIALRDLRNQILIEVNDAYRRMQESRMLLNVTELGEQTAQERLRVIVNRYKEKASLLRDVLQAQRDLYQADSQHTQAAIALWTARSDLEKAIGEELK